MEWWWPDTILIVSQSKRLGRDNLEEILFFCGQHPSVPVAHNISVMWRPADKWSSSCQHTVYRDMMLMFIGLFTLLVGGKDTNYTVRIVWIRCIAVSNICWVISPIIVAPVIVPTPGLMMLSSPAVRLQSAVSLPRLYWYGKIANCSLYSSKHNPWLITDHGQQYLSNKIHDQILFCLTMTSDWSHVRLCLVPWSHQ